MQSSEEVIRKCSSKFNSEIIAYTYLDKCEKEIGLQRILLDFDKKVNFENVNINSSLDEPVKNYEIFVGDNFRSCAPERSFSTFVPCGQITKENNKKVINVPCSGVGRFMLLQSTSETKNICLSEITVFGRPNEDDSPIQPDYTETCELTSAEKGNFLRHRKLYHVGGNWNQNENLATDGNRRTTITTGRSHYPWIVIDMEKVVEIDFVRFWSGSEETHVLKEMPKTVSVYVASKFFPCELNSHEFIKEWKFCGTFNVADLENNSVVDDYCSYPVKGQFLIVTSGLPYERDGPERILAFSEIEAFGTLTDEPAFVFPKWNNDSMSSKLTMKEAFPIRQFIFGNSASIDLKNILKVDNAITFSSVMSDHSEPLLWDPVSKLAFLIATQFGKGHLISTGSNELIQSILSNQDSVSINIMAWLGNKNRKMKITEDFKKGDLVLVMKSDKPSREQVEKAIAMLKSGDISMIVFFNEKNGITSGILKEAGIVIYPHVSQPATQNGIFELPTEEKPDFCAMGTERVFRFSLTSLQQLACFDGKWNDLEKNLMKIDLTLKKKITELALAVLQKHDDLIRYYSPCITKPLSDTNIRPFIKLLNEFLLTNILANTGYKAPANSEFPGDLPPPLPPRESITLTLMPLATTTAPNQYHTGLYLLPGDTMTLDIKQLAGKYNPNDFKVRVGCHVDHITKLDHPWQRFPIITYEKQLTEETFYSSFGGTIWIIPNGGIILKANITITFHNVVRAAFYNARESEPEKKFNKRKRYFPVPSIELIGDSVAFCVPTRFVHKLRGADVKHVIENIWDRAVKLAWHSVGFYPRQFTNNRGIHQEQVSADVQVSLGDGHAGKHIGIGMYWLPHVFDKIFFRNHADLTWGMLHEFTHNIAQSSWTFEGFIDVTNNALNLIVLNTLANVDIEKFGRIDDGGKKKTKLTEYFAQPEYGILKKEIDTALVFFYHISRCYGWGTFQKAFRYYVVNKIDPTRDQDKRDMLLKVMSNVTKTNLKPFFDYWAIPVTEEAGRETENYPCILPDDLYTQMNLNRTNQIRSQFTACSKTCPPPVQVTLPNFNEKLPNTLIIEED